MKKVLIIIVVIIILASCGFIGYSLLYSPELTDESEIQVFINDVNRLIQVDLDDVINPSWFEDKYEDVRLTKHQRILYKHAVEFSHVHNEVIDALGKYDNNKATDKMEEAIEILRDMENDMIFVKDKK
jgi:hypothetical protein